MPHPRAMARRTHVILISLAVVGAGGGVALLGGRGGSDEVRMDLHTVAHETFEVSVTASGELRAKVQTPIRSELEADSTIVEVAEEGTVVRKGDLLVRLNADDIQSQLDDEMLQLETARAEAVAADNDLKIQETENSASLSKATTDVELAEVELRKFEEGDVVEKRLELNLAVEKGHRETARLTDKVARSRELFAKDFLSKDELDKDELELIEAQAELEKAQVALRAYEDYTVRKERQKLESDLSQARAELEKAARKAESELESKKADLSTKRRRFEMLQASVAKHEDQLKKASILAPTDGLVVYATSLEQFSWMNNDQPLAVGSQIHPNQEIIMLPDTREMVAAVKVHESLIGRIRPGQSAIVTVDAAQGRRFAGTVESIGIMARSGGWRDPNVREYEVRITLDDTGEAHGLKPSMRCEARVTLSTVEAEAAVPLPAVFTDGPNQFVYVARGDRYHQTQVRVGRRSDTTAEITSGLREGDRVALREPPAARVVKAVFEASRAGGRDGSGGGRGVGSGRPGARRAGAPEGASKVAGAAESPARGEVTPVPSPAPSPAPATDESATDDESEPSTEADDEASDVGDAPADTPADGGG